MRNRSAMFSVAVFLAALMLSVLIVGLGTAGVEAAGATGTQPSAPEVSNTSTSTTLPEPGKGVPGQMIPRPNSGIAPEEPGDRGGWEQWAVLFVMVIGIGAIALLVVRESRRKRAATGS